MAGGRYGSGLDLAVRSCPRAALAFATHRAPGRRRRWLSAAATRCFNPQAGRSFCEIGTRNGDVMSCLSHFTKQLTSVEMDVSYCKKLRSNRTARRTHTAGALASQPPSQRKVGQSVSHYHTPSRELMTHTLTLLTQK